MPFRPAAACLTITAAMLSSHGVAEDHEFDLVLRQGRIVDGTGSPAYVADVGIQAGRITRIGRIAPERGRRVIDASGLIVAPGFVDLMGQTATPLIDEPESALNLLTQGITTINCGEGASAAPLSQAEGERWGWTTFREYFQLLDMQGLPVNVVQTVGHTQVRRLVLGDVDRRPSEEELEQMRTHVREAMDAGAIGLSTALIYPPAVYAEIEELQALAAVAGESGGRYFTHMRNEGDRLLDAVDEALEIGRVAGTPVHIFHLKAAGRHNWGQMQQAIARIQAARAAGRQVTADIYPYINNGLGIAAFIHPRHFAEGEARLISRLDDAEFRAEIRRELETTDGWENWFRHVGHDWNRVVIGRAGDRRYREHQGQTVAAIAAAHKEDVWETFFQLVRGGAFAMPQTMSEANLILAMQQEFISFCTDVGPATSAGFASHPRAAGAFPRLLTRYVRDLGVLSLERAVAQASAAACNDVLVYDRGRISEGQAADVIVFDYAGLTEKATFAEPRALAEGMKFVIVNGQVVFEEGKLTKARPGRVLRGPGYRSAAAPARISTGRADPRLADFDALIVQHMTRHAIPGAALAVVNGGRLVHSRGYGYADLAAQTPVQPDSLFRIASISKPITAVAVLQLVEQGRLGLDDRVFDLLDLQPLVDELMSTQGFQERVRNAGIDQAVKNVLGLSFDPRQRDITIRHLLQHRGGWDRDKSFDAMFQSTRFAQEQGVSPPAGPQQVLRAMLGQPLDFDPGERYAYSNYGYCLLGRVIEQLTGQGYEQYVQDHVLAPLGITTMRLGRTRLAQRQPGEVRYYHPEHGESTFAADLGQLVPSPYGEWYLEAMDSHGGWLASAVDLARFAAAFDDRDQCPILSRASIELMYERPEGLAGFDKTGQPLDVYYSLGWSNRDLDGGSNHWHGGSLPGTATLMVRRHDGRHFVVLFNSRVSPHGAHLTRSIDPQLHAVIDGITEWPEDDLFLTPAAR